MTCSADEKCAMASLTPKKSVSSYLFTFYLRFSAEAMHVENRRLNKEGRAANTAISYQCFLPMTAIGRSILSQGLQPLQHEDIAIADFPELLIHQIGTCNPSAATLHNNGSPGRSIP
jgi:hypothetical protein